ncbi:hypothetical protein K2173_012057 [Erythroxylum novogranatense]|uniref:Receptor-like serine/threonine-protein kinase n=1 Tax=Erythroxylum novogranatense TaxID=1862640 RepID=A0AAV8TH25_9ROSI|nr:hypothetical protein K2173_012057 [Erythroxylum novogranatense]
MAVFSLFFIAFSCLTAIASAEGRQFNISIGWPLTPTTNASWLSPSGLFAFGFYPQGNGYAVGVFLAGIPERTVVWTAKRDNPPVSGDVTLTLTSDLGLVLRSNDEQVTSIVSVTQASSASISDSGNFMIFSSDHKVIWQSFDNPTDTLLPTQRLQAGSGLISSDSETDHSTGIFTLQMQQDGNLVQYPWPVDATIAEFSYWSSGTYGAGDNVTLNLDPDGHLYLLNSTSFNIKDIWNGGSGSSANKTMYLMRIDVDGIFRLYSRNVTLNDSWSAERSSSDNRCSPKGLCGPNGYCVLMDREPDCTCLPGFAMVNTGSRRDGCERNFSAQSCKENHLSTRYTIEELPSTAWESNSYSTLASISKEDCKKACLEDCNCEAAFFNDGQCTKQKLPLRYGRRDLGNSNSAFIKVEMSMSSTTDAPKPLEPWREKVYKNDNILIVIATCSSFLILVLAICGIIVYRYHVWAYSKICRTDTGGGWWEEVAPKSFKYSELEQVTDGFREEIGRGSFGTVYKGLISENQKIVAVKRLDGVLTDGQQEFQNEIVTIGKTHHRSLVRLLGYCTDGPHRLLVYEYMSNGSLADVLFSSETRPHFEERMQIARNIARGILYLHEECETQIIHCDIKPQNILMDDHMCPKIADFGLAKLLKPDQTKTFTNVRGTRGYVAPEWHRKQPVTAKADVFSFGVVLLEVICCRRNVDNSVPENEALLEEWVFDCFQSGDTRKLVGEEEEVDLKQLNRMVKVGIWCTLYDPSLRPSMKKVLLMLEGTVDIPVPPCPTSFFSAA